MHIFPTEGADSPLASFSSPPFSMSLIMDVRVILNWVVYTLLFLINCLYCSLLRHNSCSWFYLPPVLDWMMDSGIPSPSLPKGITWAWWWMARWPLLLPSWGLSRFIQGAPIILEVREEAGPYGQSNRICSYYLCVSWGCHHVVPASTLWMEWCLTVFEHGNVEWGRWQSMT